MQDKEFYYILAEISREEDAAGRGMLSAVVVHKKGIKRPGTGFFKLAKELGRDTSDKKRCLKEELDKVFSCWSTRD